MLYLADFQLHSSWLPIVTTCCPDNDRQFLGIETHQFIERPRVRIPLNLTDVSNIIVSISTLLLLLLVTMMVMFMMQQR